MQPHAHIALCDREWFFYHEAIDYDIPSSMNIYLNMMFSIFDATEIPRGAIESVMYERIDTNSHNPIYFLYEDIIYLWMICDSCRLASLN